MEFLHLQNEPYSITHYDSLSVTIQDACYQENLLVTKDKIICPWSLKDLSEFEEKHFHELLGLNPELIIFGQKNQKSFLPAKWHVAFSEKKVGVEHMTFESACRTYNILLSDLRIVVLVLLFS